MALTAEKSETLLEKAVRLLHEDEATGRTLHALSHEVELSYFWLRKVKSGETKDPGVNQIEKLLKFFDSSQNA